MADELEKPVPQNRLHNCLRLESTWESREPLPFDGVDTNYICIFSYLSPNWEKAISNNQDTNRENSESDICFIQ